MVSKSCGFGRRFTARGSTRPGRLPMTWPVRFARAASIKLATAESSLNTMTSQLAAIDCMAAVKLSPHGDCPDSRAAELAFPA